LVLVLFLAFAVRGLMRGLIAEIFTVIGLLAGLWTAGWVSQWILGHWRGAQPAVAFFFLRWLVVVAAAFTVAALCHWGGELMKRMVGATPAGVLDRAAGLLLGATLGAIVAAFTVLAFLSPTWPRGLAESAARARTARPLMASAAGACAAAGRLLPGGGWLHLRFLAAAHRAHRHPRSS
jgi:Colicin V production protein